MPKPQMVAPEDSGDLLSDIKKDAKSIIVVMLLCVAMNLDQVNSMFANVSLFVTEAGGLNMQAVVVKAILIGILYFIVTNKLL